MNWSAFAGAAIYFLKAIAAVVQIAETALTVISLDTGVVVGLNETVVLDLERTATLPSRIATLGFTADLDVVAVGVTPSHVLVALDLPQTKWAGGSQRLSDKAVAALLGLSLTATPDDTLYVLVVSSDRIP